VALDEAQEEALEVPQEEALDEALEVALDEAQLLPPDEAQEVAQDVPRGRDEVEDRHEERVRCIIIVFLLFLFQHAL
jgi:hypothetical protein